MGAWSSIHEPLEGVLVDLEMKCARPAYAGRIASASTATGLASRHAAEQEELVNQALTI